MQVSDLGPISGDLTLFGGPYSNRHAFEALIKQAAGTRMICTGDLVAYCGAPQEVVAQARAIGIDVVAGNCEKQLANNAHDCGCGFEEGTACDLLSAGWYAYANSKISPSDRAWMGALPDVITFEHAGKRYAVLHGGISDVSRFLWSASASQEFSEEINLIRRLCGDVDVVIAGHSGIAYSRTVGQTLWINAGVIGMPPNDGTAQTEYVRLSSAGVITFEKLNYDAASAAADMKAAGLTQGYHATLLSGIWPSEDVLPPELRRG